MLKIHIWSCDLGGVLTAIRQPYLTKKAKKNEQNSLNSFLCYPKLVNTFQYSIILSSYSFKFKFTCCLLNFLAWVVKDEVTTSSILVFVGAMDIFPTALLYCVSSVLAILLVEWEEEKMLWSLTQMERELSSFSFSR